MIIIITNNIKAAPWDDINFRFQFRTEVVYPTDHVFIFFRIFIFLQIFLFNISMKPEVTQTNYLYTWRTIEYFHSIGPHADGIGPALGRQSVLQVCFSRVLTMRHQLAATGLILPSDACEYVI